MSNLGGNGMYKNRNQDGSNNLCGGRVKQLRLRALPKLSQRDIELKAFADYFGVPADLLLSDVPIK